MREEAEKNDRDPDALELTLGHSLSVVTPEKAEKLAGLGRAASSCAVRRPRT